MTRFYAFLILSLFIMLTACDDTAFDCIQKAGEEKTINISLPDFHSINANDGVNIVLRQGNSQKVTLTAGENLIEEINLEVDDAGYLDISNSNSCNWVRSYRGITLDITTPNILLINQFGYGTIKSDGILRFPDFTINAKNGTGDITLKIESNNFYTVSNTVANFYVSGNTNALWVGFYYSDGIFYGKELTANKVSITHLGTNKIEVTALDELKGTLQSIGEIVYHGNPSTVDVLVSGQGALVKK